jgi:lipoate-protein ligase A
MHCVTDAAGEQAWNMAALAASPVVPDFRVWRWPRSAIVLGRSQRGLLGEVRERAGGEIEVLAREAGGGAVLVGPWMVGASVVLPIGHRLLGANLTDAYRWLGEAYLAALQGSGVQAALVEPAALRSAPAPREPVGWACYGSLSPWELVDPASRKLVGLAQQRRRDAVLLVSGLLAGAPDWPLLCRALGREDDLERLVAWTSSIEALRGEALGEAVIAQLAGRLDAAIAAALGTAIETTIDTGIG